MNDGTVVHQIECRWRKREDFRPIATSCDPRTTDMWFSRLRVNVRPPEQKVNVRGSQSSVFYQTYNNGEAAVVWRQHDIDAISFEDSGNRRPLVARILVGTISSLDPDVAMALCCGWQQSGLIDPKSGRAQIGQPLPVLRPSDLRSLVFKLKTNLDSQARRAPGLARLIAAVLRDQQTPLNVQLPPDQLGEPGSGAQVLLLRGLWCTTRPLLEGLPDASSAGISWSFSTYEPPVGESEPSTLPHIVFRAVQSGQQPAAGFHRPETRVLPRDQAGLADPDDVDEVADLLASAYQRLGGAALAGRLSDVAMNNRTLARRLEETRLALRNHGRTGPGRKPAGREQRRLDHDAEDHLVSQVNADQADTLQAESAQIITADPERPDVDQAEPEQIEASATDVAPTDRTDELASATAALAGWMSPAMPPAGMADSRAFSTAQTRPAEQPPTREAAHPAIADSRLGRHRSQPRDADEFAESMIMQIIRIIRDNPDPATFKTAMKWLKDLQTPSLPERTAARRELLRAEWCYAALREHDASGAGLILERLFELTVIPDVQRADVQTELAEWAYPQRARATVVQALFRAAGRNGDEAITAMNAALFGALGRRWADQNDIAIKEPDVSPDAKKGLRAPRPDETLTWYWRFFPPGRSAAAICLLTFALVLSLLFR